SSENALLLSRMLQDHPKVGGIHYPGLASSPYYDLAERQFPRGKGGLLTFSLASAQECFALMDALKVISRATNVNDNKSLIIHPASTIYSEYEKSKREDMGVLDTLLRLSVGIEDCSDLIEDLEQGLSKI
ncbi:MAG: O-acetylhomoserine aminocarboxypropyltransferase/cysteine synthase, partial [Planctomycetes bacterium]|nr:O-acetylhomoserine aminocarboxypropyltransferase/cysteine synthase [Planctomycetota bacterium]